MNYKLIINPALEMSSRTVEFQFNTMAEMRAARESCSLLLLFVQNELNAMMDYSNVFFMLEGIDDEWYEIEEDEE